MNTLDCIRTFVNQQANESGLPDCNSIATSEPILAALKALAKSNKWLSDRRLVEQAVSRLKEFTPQNPKERATVAAVYLKIINMNGCNGITSAGSTSPDIPVIKMGDAFSATQWKCLKKLHALTPITHLEIEGNNNLEKFLEFFEYNPTIVSLKICESAAITDDQLAKMARLLPKLDTLCLHSETITCIPQTLLDNLVTLDCSDCPALTDLYTPNAKSVTCSKCRSLTSIAAPCATLLNCKSCPKLAKIDAPILDDLNCGSCPALTSIETNATTIYCVFSIALTSLVAPNATNINCAFCEALTKLEAPKAINLNCGECIALTRIKAPNAESLQCNGCKNISIIIAPKATELVCFSCDILDLVVAPCALTVQCNYCPLLKSIEAPKSTHIECNACALLTSVHAPNALEIKCDYCPSLAPPRKRELFITVYMNLLLTYYATPDVLAEQLPPLFSVAQSSYGVSDATDLFLHSWLLSVLEQHIPAEFESTTERLQCEHAIEGHLDRLITQATTETSLKTVDFDWFKNLKKLHSPQQQMCRVMWLGCLLACGAVHATHLADPEAVQTLTAIGNLIDPMLQAGATRALLSMYAKELPQQKNTWKSLQDNGVPHLHLPRLFLACTDIQQEKAKELLECLNSKPYSDFKQLNPILETIYALSQNSSIPVTERANVLTFLLQEPAKDERENAKLFAERTSAFRCLQQERVTACRDLLLFGQGRQLIGVQSDINLQERHKQVCQTIFGVKAELAASFAEMFRSTRYPNGLFTYAARLQTLPRDDKIPLTELLGKFVNGYLKGEFPANRYDMEDNAHLKRVFQYDTRLLGKWKEPLEIDLSHTEIASRAGPSKHDIIKKQIRFAIDNRHLGEDQERLYPALMQAMHAEDIIDTQSPIARIEKTIKDIQDLLNTPSPSDHASSKEAQARLEVELYCFKALDPTAEDHTRIGHLRCLLMKLPDGLEFKRDVHDLLRVLTRQRKPTARLTKLQTTESWEDLLLMGTEVNHSCQRIDGDPYLNKCLLAYILDGKNQLIIVRDSMGRIAARSVLRILWDRERNCPVLFMEHTYTNIADPTLQDLIIKGCVEKAKSMQLTLVASATSFPQGRPHLGALQAFGGPAVFEYVDALKGIQYNGKFTILTSKTIYTPDAEGGQPLPYKRKRELL